LASNFSDAFSPLGILVPGNRSKWNSDQIFDSTGNFLKKEVEAPENEDDDKI
jgi:hypothetical protein